MYSEKIKKRQKWELRGDSTEKVKVVDYYGGLVITMDIHGTGYGKRRPPIQESQFRKYYRLIQDV